MYDPDFDEPDCIALVEEQRKFFRQWRYDDIPATLRPTKPCKSWRRGVGRQLLERLDCDRLRRQTLIG